MPVHRSSFRYSYGGWKCERDNPPTCSPNKFFGRREPWRLRTEALQRPGAAEGIASADSAEAMEVQRACPWGSIIHTLLINIHKVSQGLENIYRLEEVDHC